MQPNNSSDYPSDLDSFVGKQMLFKVEVSDGNLLHNWRNYAVKRTTADEDVINRFVVFHNIKVYYEPTSPLTYLWIEWLISYSFSFHLQRPENEDVANETLLTLTADEVCHVFFS